MEKRNYFKKIILTSVVILALAIAGDACNIFSDGIYKFFRNTSLIGIALCAFYGIVTILRCYGVFIGKGENKLERKTFAWGLRFLISMLSFIGIGLLGFVIYDLCTEAQIIINDTLVFIYKKVMIFLGAFFIFAFVVYSTHNIYMLYRK